MGPQARGSALQLASTVTTRFFNTPIRGGTVPGIRGIDKRPSLPAIRTPFHPPSDTNHHLYIRNKTNRISPVSPSAGEVPKATASAIRCLATPNEDSRSNAPLRSTEPPWMAVWNGCDTWGRCAGRSDDRHSSDDAAWHRDFQSCRSCVRNRYQSIFLLDGSIRSMEGVSEPLWQGDAICFNTIVGAKQISCLRRRSGNSQLHADGHRRGTVLRGENCR